MRLFAFGEVYLSHDKFVKPLNPNMHTAVLAPLIPIRNIYGMSSIAVEEQQVRGYSTKIGGQTMMRAGMHR